MTNVQLAKLLANVDPAVLGQLLGTKAVKQPKRTKAEMLANKDKAIRSAFTKRGIKDVVLMDRADPAKPFNVRPFGRQANDDGPATGWIGQGRIVKKGEKSVRGLFHVSQTEPLAE